MSAGNRIRGAETAVYIISTGHTQSLASIKSFDVAASLKILEEKYVGQTTNQFDDILDGFSGKIELQLDTPAAFDFMNSLALRAQRRVPLFTVNIATVFNFPLQSPAGGRRRVMFPDVYFDDFPINVPSRTDYVNVTLTWKGSQIQPNA